MVHPDDKLNINGKDISHEEQVKRDTEFRERWFQEKLADEIKMKDERRKRSK